MEKNLDDVARMTDGELDKALYRLMRPRYIFRPTYYAPDTLWLLESMRRRGYDCAPYGDPKTGWTAEFFVYDPSGTPRFWGTSHTHGNGRRLTFQRAVCEAALRALRARKPAEPSKSSKKPSAKARSNAE